MKLASIARYPVKSFAGERVDACALGERGLDGDRVRALLDTATRTIVSAKDPRRFPAVLAHRAAFVPSDGGGRVRVTLPGGDVAWADADDVDAVLSRSLGRAVRMVAHAAPETLLRRAHTSVADMGPKAEDPDGATEDVFAVLAPGTLFDAAPVHVVTTASLRALRGASSDADARRFRPNLVVDVEEAFVENAWCGRALHIGDPAAGGVVLRVVEPTPRCIVPSLAHDELPPDLGVLRALVAHNRVHVASARGTYACLGVYATVERAGVVRVGDDVRLADGSATAGSSAPRE